MYNGESEAKTNNRSDLNNCTKQFPGKLRSSIISCSYDEKNYKKTRKSVFLNSVEVKNIKYNNLRTL